MDGKGRMVHKASNQLLALVQRGGGRVEMRPFREADREVLLIDVLLAPSTPLPLRPFSNFLSLCKGALTCYAMIFSDDLGDIQISKSLDFGTSQSQPYHKISLI